MHRYVDYIGTPSQALEAAHNILVSQGYEIDWYTPEGRIIVTKPKWVAKDIRKYQYAVIVYVQDLIHLVLIGEETIFKRSSEWSIGGKALTEVTEKDRLPYSVQQKIYDPILTEFEKLNYFEFDREAGKRIMEHPKKLNMIPVETTNSISKFPNFR